MPGPGPDRSTPSEWASATIGEFRRKELLVYASAISFRALVATIPMALFVVAVLGFLGLEDVWSDEVAPGLRENVSEAVFTVIDDAVNRVLGGQNGYWLTIGAVAALISMASIVEAQTRTINRLHEVEDSRSILDRVTNSLAVGAAGGALVLAALAVVRLGPFAFEALLGDGAGVEVLSFVVRWGLAAGLLVVLLVLTRRVAPDLEQPLPLLAGGSAFIVAGWIGMSLLFGLYLRYVANYGSVFGNLATVYIAVQYIALSAIVYVAGLVVDKLASEPTRR